MVGGEDQEWAEDEWGTRRKGRFSIKPETYNPNVRRLFNSSFILNRVKFEPWRGRERKIERKITIETWSTRGWRRVRDDRESGRGVLMMKMERLSRKKYLR